MENTIDKITSLGDEYPRAKEPEIDPNSLKKPDYTDITTPVTPEMKKLTITYLKNTFPSFHMMILIKALEESKYHLYPSWKRLYDLQTEYFLDELDRQIEEAKKEQKNAKDPELERALKASLADSPPPASSSSSSSSSRSRTLSGTPEGGYQLTLECIRQTYLPMPMRPTEITDNSPEFDQEMLFVLENEAKMAVERKKLMDRKHEKLDIVMGIGHSYLWDCPICYTDDKVASEQIVCENGHEVCVDCLRDSVQAAVKNSAPQITCIAEPDCNYEYPEAVIKRAIGDGELYQRWSELSMFQNMRLSKIPTLNCPFCIYAEYLTEKLEEIDEQELVLNPEAALKKRKEIPLVFKCRRKECGKESCTICWKEAHPLGTPCPLQAESNKKRGDLEENLIHYVELAIDKAYIRVCPKCGTPGVKESGCNRIPCKCGQNYCYLCQKACPDGNPYDHFEKPPTYCKVHSDTAADDEKICLAAAEKAEQEWRKAHPGYKGAPLALGELTKKRQKK